MKNFPVRFGFIRHTLTSILVSATIFHSSEILAFPVDSNNSSVHFMQIGVTGLVKDAVSGAILPGANVALKGAGARATTDENGKFSIQVQNSKSVLQISYAGYTTIDIIVGDRKEITVLLQPVSSELNQVVVVGYGTQSKRNVTSSIKSIRAESFNRGIINNPQQLLQGKVAGVNVTSTTGEPGAVTGITVRGPGGIRTGSTPLFVVDGIPLDNSSTGGGDPLNFLNPADIESIDVLKDASATAIYGSRGANGVILLTTKKGKSGASSLTYNTSYGVSRLANALPVYSADDFRREVAKLGSAVDDKGGNTDWQKEITRTAITQNHNISMSGGADKLVYYASFGLQKQQGIIKTNQLNRYSGRFNATQRFLNDKLIIDANMSYNSTTNIRPNVSGAIGDALSNNPTYKALDSAGNIAIYQLSLIHI